MTRLTRYQHEVLRRALKGHDYHEIAELLGVSEEQVVTGLRKAMRRLSPGERRADEIPTSLDRH